MIDGHFFLILKWHIYLNMAATVYFLLACYDSHRHGRCQEVSCCKYHSTAMIFKKAMLPFDMQINYGWRTPFVWEARLLSPNYYPWYRLAYGVQNLEELLKFLTFLRMQSTIWSCSLYMVRVIWIVISVAICAPLWNGDSGRFVRNIICRFKVVTHDTALFPQNGFFLNKAVTCLIYRWYIMFQSSFWFVHDLFST